VKKTPTMDNDKAVKRQRKARQGQARQMGFGMPEAKAPKQQLSKVRRH
jgi:hypothetical protein